MISRMKVRAVSFVILCFGVTLSCFAQAADPAQAPLSEYARLVARVKSGDLYIDYKKLRLAYAASPERRNAKDTAEARQASVEAVLHDKFEKTIELVDFVLENDYTNIDAHILEARAYLKLGNKEKSSFHQTIATGLLTSILEDRNGKDKKSAWQVISEEEEKMVLYTFGFRAVGHSTAKDGKHTFDIVEAVNLETQEKRKMYFNVDLMKT